MFFIRYSWGLPFKLQCAIGIALLAALATAHSSTTQAEEFAATHHARCMRQQGAADPAMCAIRTIQLASHMHGMAFAEQVAEALR
jgi:hypothetical protein